MSLCALIYSKITKITSVDDLTQIMIVGIQFTAISRKVVGKMCTRQSRKVLWDMINTLFLTTVAIEPTFVAFL